MGGKVRGDSITCQSLQTKPGTGPTDSTLPPTTAQYGSLDSDVVKKFLVQQDRGPTALPHLTIIAMRRILRPFASVLLLLQ